MRHFTLWSTAVMTKIYHFLTPKNLNLRKGTLLLRVTCLRLCIQIANYSWMDIIPPDFRQYLKKTPPPFEMNFPQVNFMVYIYNYTWLKQIVGPNYQMYMIPLKTISWNERQIIILFRTNKLYSGSYIDPQRQQSNFILCNNQISVTQYENELISLLNY